MGENNYTLGLLLASCMALLAAVGPAFGQLAPSDLSASSTPLAHSGSATTKPLTVSVTIPTPPHRITSAGRDDELSADGLGFLLLPGKPALPSKIHAIAIPTGAGLLDASWRGLGLALGRLFEGSLLNLVAFGVFVIGVDALFLRLLLKTRRRVREAAASRDASGAKPD